ncbi:hypothetical protein C8R47DRAFT_1226171 [Mycena vitilis]|nr:hypothetical protein C8R47DRAFT_1226171 [Mycena vitilis]
MDADDIAWVAVSTLASPSRSTVQDVVYQPWLFPGVPEHMEMFSFDRCTIRVEFLPGRDPIKLANAISILTVEQLSNVRLPFNNLVGDMLGNGDGWHGNVLVLRHIFDGDGFEDIADEDVRRIKFIVKRVVGDWARLVYRN